MLIRAIGTEHSMTASKVVIIHDKESKFQVLRYDQFQTLLTPRHLRVCWSYVVLFILIHHGCQLCQWFSVLFLKEYPHLLPCLLAYFIDFLNIFHGYQSMFLGMKATRNVRRKERSICVYSRASAVSSDSSPSAIAARISFMTSSTSPA
jgi:hypothetical protein